MDVDRGQRTLHEAETEPSKPMEMTETSMTSTLGEGAFDPSENDKD